MNNVFFRRLRLATIVVVVLTATNCFTPFCSKERASNLVYASTDDDEFAFDSNEIETKSGEDGLRVVRVVPHGALAKLDGVCDVLYLEGTPEQMGAAHGTLIKDAVVEMKDRVRGLGAAAKAAGKIDFFNKIDEAIERTKVYTPDRFYDEIDALADAAGIERVDARRINSFPELFHCSGVALRGKATKDGRVLHARVLDYMSDVGLQNNATIIVYQPQGRNAWISVSYAAFVGTVTAMNEKGLAIGEMGGAGEGKWDGLPMAFMMRRVVEECETVDEALTLMKSVPLTCDYYYVLSDARGNLAAVEAIAGADEPVVTLRPGVDHPKLPGALEDVVYISAGKRVEALYERLKENYGKIDVEVLMETIKRPVAMESNLHDAIFAPETRDLWRAEATATQPACDQPYYRINLLDALDFFARETAE